MWEIDNMTSQVAEKIFIYIKELFISNKSEEISNGLSSRICYCEIRGQNSAANGKSFKKTFLAKIVSLKITKFKNAPILQRMWI